VQRSEQEPRDRQHRFACRSSSGRSAPKRLPGRRAHGRERAPRRVRAATTASAPPAAQDEARNCGEINHELLLRPEAEVVLGRAVRRCRPTAGFVRFLQPEAADPNRRTYRRASPRETKSGAPIVVANLVPTHDRGPGPPGDRSTWLLLSPNLERPAAALRTIAFILPRPRVARSRWRRTGRPGWGQRRNVGYQVCSAARTSTSLTATRRSRVTM
jgi:hypothetical protein